MTTLLLVLAGVIAQPFAFHGEGGTVTAIVDPTGWCAARPDGPRVGSTFSFEGAADYDLGEGRFGGDAWVTLDGRQYLIGVTYYPDTDYVVGGASQGIFTFNWPTDRPGIIALTWDGIPDPPDETGQGYEDCRMTTEVGPLVHRLPGDANSDGRFTTADLVLVFAAGEYQDAVLDNSTWATGDWNADRDFYSNDLVMAMQTGVYEQPTASMVVPEPSAVVLLVLGCVLTYGETCRRTRRV